MTRLNLTLTFLVCVLASIGIGFAQDALSQQGGNVRGQIVDTTEQQTPIAGVTVRIVATDGTEFTTTTNADGDYETSGIPAGRYLIYISKDGYGDRVVPITPVFNSDDHFVAFVAGEPVIAVPVTVVNGGDHLVILQMTKKNTNPVVHALLIILGNDPKPAYRASVDINQEAMIGLMEIVSRSVEVHMTLMKSEPGRRGEVRNTHLVNTEIRDEDYPKQLGIIKPTQVTEWIRNLEVGPSDTVLVYFNGHGKMDRYRRHQLLFDTKDTKRLARDVVLEALQETPGRLKMLITDTCSTVTQGTQPAGGDYFAQYGDTEAKPQFYAQNLFLEHTGILDITATSPEIRTASDTDKAYADADVGGFFTYALTTALVPDADTNGDDFLSWEEAFAATETGIKRLCEKEPLLNAQNIIQQPVAHRPLPTRIDGSSTEPPEPPDTTVSTAILNFTSVPSGAEVEIDGFVVGKTPLNGYELETDGRSTKDIEVTIKAAGYEDSVKKFRVPRGKPFEWEFELTKKAPDIPKTILIDDSSTEPPELHDTTASTAILNFTSVPSGATVSIDNAIVGKTPLTNYEIEMDGGSKITVTIKASGYEDSVETFGVQRGKPLNWEFELTKKATEIPTQPPVITPATVGQSGAKFDDTLLQGHTGRVYSVSFSPDGKTIASGSADHTLRLWDASTRKLIRTLTGHTESVKSVSFSPDGKTIASGSADHTLRLWDASTGKLIRTIKGHTDWVYSVSFSPDGKTIASGSRDDTIRLWEVSTGKLIRTIKGHTNTFHIVSSSTVNSVSFSPDGKTIASGSRDDMIRLWEVSTGKLIRTIKGHRDQVYSVSFSPDGKTIASGSQDDTIRLWDASTGKLIRTLTGHTESVNSVSFSPDGKTIASGSWDDMIRLWEVSTGKLIHTLTEHTNVVDSVSFSPDGRRIASGSWDDTVRLWQLAD